MAVVDFMSPEQARLTGHPRLAQHVHGRLTRHFADLIKWRELRKLIDDTGVAIHHNDLPRQVHWCGLCGLRRGCAVLEGVHAIKMASKKYLGVLSSPPASANMEWVSRRIFSPRTDGEPCCQ